MEIQLLKEVASLKSAQSEDDEAIQKYEADKRKIRREREAKKSYTNLHIDRHTSSCMSGLRGCAVACPEILKIKYLNPYNIKIKS